MKKFATAVATAGMLALVFALVVLPGAALAKGGHRHARADRNHDGIPDRWERRFHLSLRVNEARRDQDRDGLNNGAEFRDHTNPRRADSDGDGLRDGMEVQTGNDPNDRDTDNDGVRDGNEDAGTIVSFENGVLTIQVGNDTVSGQVNDQTRLRCENENEAEHAVASRHGDQGDGGDRSGPSENSGPGNAGDNSGSGDDHGVDNPADPAQNENENENENEDHGAGQQDQGNQNAQACTTDALTPGRAVHEAELESTAQGAVFEKVEVVL